MLYLIRTFGRGKNKTALKVGFSEDLGKRLGMYKISNPFFERISTRQGTLMDELKIHLYLEALGYKAGFLNEWFVDCPEVISGFHQSNRKIDRTIWAHRDDLFSISDFKSNGNKLKKELYENLSRKFPKKRTKKIDSDWLYVLNMSVIRESQKDWKEWKKKFE